MPESADISERNKVASQIKNIRKSEKLGVFDANRDGKSYLNTFLGLREVFNYVRALNTSNLVLDVGAGTTRGISEISRSCLGKSLDFKATVLYRHPDIEKNLGHQKTISTSAEVLRGVANTSVGAILGLNSFAYSDSLNLVANRFDEVLVPGGLIKATFLSNEIKGRLGTLGIKTYNKFLTVLREKEYDIATISQGTYDILIAIKPGLTNVLSARQLLESDITSKNEQQSLLNTDVT